MYSRFLFRFFRANAFTFFSSISRSRDSRTLSSTEWRSRWRVLGMGTGTLLTLLCDYESCDGCVVMNLRVRSRA